MTKRERDALAFRDWSLWAFWRGGATYRQAAELVGVTWSTAYQRVAKCRRRLRHPRFRALMNDEG